MGRTIIIADSDREYLARIARFAFPKETEEGNVLLCGDMKEFAAARAAHGDVLVVITEELAVSSMKLLYDVPMILLAERKESGRFPDAAKIQKYQRAEALAAAVREADAEGKERVLFEKPNGKIVMFTSASGGCGTSSLAVDCAVDLSREGKRVLYLNLEPCGLAGFYFRGNTVLNVEKFFEQGIGETSSEEFIKTAVNYDASGIAYMDSPRNILNNQKVIGSPALASVAKALCETGLFDYCIVDKPFSFSEDWIFWMDSAAKVIFVTDGSDVSNLKTARAFLCLPKEKYMEKAALFYNRINMGNFVEMSHIKIPVLGKVESMVKTRKPDILAELGKRHLFTEKMFE